MTKQKFLCIENKKKKIRIFRKKTTVYLHNKIILFTYAVQTNLTC